MTSKKSFSSRTTAFLTAFLFILTIIMVLPVGNLRAKADDNNGITLDMDRVTITKDGEVLTNESNVKNGDTVQIELWWRVDDGVQTTGSTINLSLGLVNLILKNATGGSLYYEDTENNVVIGSYEINGETITITIDENSNQLDGEDSRYIRVTLQATVNFNEDEAKENGYVDIEAASKKYTPKPDVAGSQLYGQSKGYSEPPRAELVNGEVHFYQKYVVKATADGSVNNIKFTDTPDPEFFKGVVEGSVKVYLNGTETLYSNISIANNSLSFDVAGTLSAGETITVEYEIELNREKYLSKAQGFHNTAKFDYTDDMGSNITGNNNECWGVSFDTLPSVSKTASPSNIDRDKFTSDMDIEWTIAIDLRGYYTILTANDNWKSILITDIPSTNLKIMGDAAAKIKNGTLTLGDFIDHRNGIFTYKYTTKPDNVNADSVDQEIVFLNTATVNIDGKDYSYTGKATVGGKSALTKSFVGEDSDGCMEWALTINVYQEGFTEATITDFLSYSTSKHRLIKDSVKLVIGSNSYDLSGDIEIPSYDTGRFIIDLSKYLTYINSANGQSVKITYKTEPINNDGERDQNAFSGSYNYSNSANLEYTPTNGDKRTDSDYAEHKLTVDSIAEKWGSATNDTFPICWTIYIKSDAKVQDYAVGETLIFVDQIPDHLIFDADKGVQFKDQNGNDLSQYLDKSFYVYNQGENTLTITVKITDALNRVLSTDLKWYFAPTLTYYTNLDPDSTEWFFNKCAEYTNSGSKVSFTNNVTITHNGESVGSDNDTIWVGKGNILTKNADYEFGMDNTGLYDSTNVASYGKLNVFYSVDINPNAYKLSNSGTTIIAVDKMGKDLQLIKSSVRVINADTNEEISYESSFNPDTNTMTYILPDKVHIRLEYYASIMGDSGTSFEGLELDNTITIEAYNTSYDSKNTMGNGFILQSSAGAGSDNWGITLYKYTQIGEREFEELPGVGFELDCVEYSNGSWINSSKNPYHRSGTTNQLGELTFNGLMRGNIYRLKETKPLEGYTSSSDAYYFYLKGNNSVTLPEGVEVKEVKLGEILNILNLSEFSVEKTYEGSAQMSDAQISNVISNTEFTVSVASGADQNYITAKTVSLKWNKTSGKAKLDLPDEFLPGVVYKISETKTPVGFITSKDIYVKVEDSSGTEKVYYAYSLSGTWTELISKRLVINNESIDNIELIKEYSDLDLAALASDADVDLDAWLAATEFTLTDNATGIAVDDASPVWDSTKKKAVVTFSGSKLQTGHRYTLTETKVPRGYTSSGKKLECSVANNGTIKYYIDGSSAQTLTCVNTKTSQSTGEIDLIINKKWHNSTDNSDSAPAGVNEIKVNITYNGKTIGSNISITPDQFGDWSYEKTYSLSELGTTSFDPSLLKVEELSGSSKYSVKVGKVVYIGETAAVTITNTYQTTSSGAVIPDGTDGDTTDDGPSGGGSTGSTGGSTGSSGGSSGNNQKSEDVSSGAKLFENGELIGNSATVVAVPASLAVIAAAFAGVFIKRRQKK